jgi:hypothetical protein
MTFSRHIETLNVILSEKQPVSFNPSWILKNASSTYQYIQKNIRTEANQIDWDAVTHSLDREFQQRWVRRRQYKIFKEYEDQEELNLVLNKYKDKLYTFIAPLDEKDREVRNRIIIAIVRIAQKGNVLARNELVKWITYIVESWLEKHWQIFKWKGYPDEVEDKIKGCIRCYRYTGSFVGYLFKTLEFSARGKPPESSTNDKLFEGESERIDFIVQETERYKYSSC